MASNNQQHAILDLGIDDLQFTTNDYKTTTNQADQGGFTSFPDPEPQSNKDTERILDDDGNPNTSGLTKSTFFKLSFYQQYFDVEDKDILSRLLYSMVPVPGKSFLQHHIRPKPDLYGPFWACVTLIFSIAISGNVADYFTTSLEGQTKWHYDFHKVNLAATAVFSYAGLIPACLYGYLWWAGHGAGSLAVSFVELVCVYGYSLVIYIPISILWLICVKFGWGQWILVLVAASLSGVVLFTTIWPAVRENAPKSSLLVMIVVLGMHFLLAAGFMLYFFHGSGTANNIHEVTSLAPAPANNGTGPVNAALVQDPTESIVNAAIITTFNPDKDKSTTPKGIPVNQPTDKVNEIIQQVSNATDKSINAPNDKVTAEDQPTAAVIDNNASKIEDNNTETTASKTDNKASKDVLTTVNSNEKADKVEDRDEAVTEVQIMTTKNNTNNKGIDQLASTIKTTMAALDKITADNATVASTQIQNSTKTN